MEKFFEGNNVKIKKISLSQGKQGHIIYSDIKMNEKLTKIFDMCYSAVKLVEGTRANEKSLKYENILFEKMEEAGENYVHRFHYWQEITENNSPENKYHAVVIMQNPAFAYSEKTDLTINNVYSYLKENGFKSFEIVNFNPIRTPLAKMLTKLEKEKEYSQYDEINRKFLEKVLDNAQENKNAVIIAAWGGSQRDNKTAKKFFEGKDYKLYCFGMTSEKFPKHFSPLSYNNVNKFPYPIPYLEFNNWIKTQNLTACCLQENI